MKPGKTFKLAKSYKRMIALMKGATDEQRNQFKRMMIDAQLCSEIVVKNEKKDRGPRAGNGNGSTYVAPETV
jgi:hypothetical protein